MTAIPATRRAMRELVDGTIRVQLDIDPPHRKAFLEAFPAIDMPVAIVPLELGVEIPPPKAEPIGPRCMLAVQWCKDVQFQEWLATLYAVEFNEHGATEAIYGACGIKSRRQLDDEPRAGALFDEKIRRPYQAYLRMKEGSHV